MNPQRQYGEVLRELRELRGLSQSEFARRAGVSVRTIQRLEQAGLTPSIRVDRKLGAVLHGDESRPGLPNPIVAFFDAIYAQPNLRVQILAVLRNSNSWLVDSALLEHAREASNIPPGAVEGCDMKF